MWIRAVYYGVRRMGSIPPKNSFCTVWVWALEVPPVTIPEVGDCSQIYSTARSCGTNHGVVRHHFVVTHFLVGCGVWGACLGSSDWGDKDEPSCPNGHSIVGFNFFAWADWARFSDPKVVPRFLLVMIAVTESIGSLSVCVGWCFCDGICDDRRNGINRQP